ncbi:MAG TPA: MFS transporter [Pirellulaceae bacterium]|nr:MFS transporter [Pirellulaceae bacterium]
MSNPYKASRDAPQPEIVGARLVEPGQRPTRIRYWIIGLTCAMSVILYLDRFCIGPVTEKIIEEIHLDRKQFGWAIGMFFWSYALMQVPSGWVCDRFGSRVALPLYVVGWSLAVMLLGAAHSLIAFLVLRLLLGMAQAGAYPAAAGYIKKWIPLAGRARANSIVTMGGRAGGLIAFFATPLLMLYALRALEWEVGGWRIVFVGYGLLGVVWAVAFWWLFRERPEDHPRCNAAEVALVEPTLAGATPTPPLNLVLALVQHPNVLLLSLSGFFVNIGWIFLVTWLPSYLKDAYADQLTDVARDVSQWFGYTHTITKTNAYDLLAGPMVAFTGLAGMCGSLSGGMLADFLLRKFGPIWGRRLPGMCAAFVACSAYAACLFTTDVRLFIVLAAAIYFLTDLGLGALWATYQDFGGKYVSSVLGFANMCGNLGAAVFSSVFGYMAEDKMWSAVFITSGCSFLVVACCWLFVDPTRKFVVEET